MAEAAKLKQEGAGSEGSSIQLPGAVARIAEYPKRLRLFFHETRVEMARVNWPSKADVISTTLVVVVTVALFAAFFAVVDSGLGYVINLVFKHFKA
jgi:preprotein translocase subunit SecE